MTCRRCSFLRGWKSAHHFGLPNLRSAPDGQATHAFRRAQARACFFFAFLFLGGVAVQGKCVFLWVNNSVEKRSGSLTTIVGQGPILEHSTNQVHSNRPPNGMVSFMPRLASWLSLPRSIKIKRITNPKGPGPSKSDVLWPQFDPGFVTYSPPFDHPMVDGPGPLGLRVTTSLRPRSEGAAMSLLRGSSLTSSDPPRGGAGWSLFQRVVAFPDSQ